jgi:hypothetical protein
MRITITLALLVLVGCGPVAADTLKYRCVELGKETNPAAILLVTIDPLLGEMKAERYSGKTLRSRIIYRIDVMNESITRGGMFCRYWELRRMLEQNCIGLASCLEPY